MRNIIFNENKLELDNGYFFGRGVFETILIKNKPVFLKEHIERLNKGIKALELGEEILIDDILRIIDKYEIKYCVLKIAVSEKNIVLEIRENKYKAEDYLNGFSLKISKINRNSKSKLTYIKSLNYLENILEREEALKNGYDEVLFLNEYGFVAEGSISNIFVVKEDKIFTPNVECGLLPGVVRRFIIDEFQVVEKEITLEELYNADEVFITNSLLGIMGISQLEEKIFKDNRITTRIRDKYEVRIGD
ncbi:aminotransferase class IV [Clostridium sp. AL.422]|uniref:aminotransferase class IV n=1 Tax=Clostridium TaxID=1485 RepID=UPI00293DCC28|nr:MULTISPECIES: aminotransferase class IV [unclassified Clostridium]MDV4152666.1 aminotransferase class IV [Clostridium sp. AL.422]